MKFSSSEEESPTFQVAPLIDIVFLVLIFFVAAAVYRSMETEIPIDIPVASESKSIERTPGKIIINVDKEGQIIVNQRQLTLPELEAILKKVSTNFPNQAVIIRGDKSTPYDEIIKVLNSCIAAKIWNISFATVKSAPEEK